MPWLDAERKARLDRSMKFVRRCREGLERRAMQEPAFEPEWRRVGGLQLRVIELMTGYGAARKSFTALRELYDVWIGRLQAIYEKLSADESTELWEILRELRADLRDIETRCE